MEMDLLETEGYKGRRRIRSFLLGAGILVLVLVGVVGSLIYWAFYDMDRLPVGEYVTEESSPDGKYTVKAYVTNGGATTSYAIRGELVMHEQKGKTTNIYWNDQEDSADIEWIDNDRVVINGHALHVPKEKYDFRND